MIRAVAVAAALGLSACGGDGSAIRAEVGGDADAVASETAASETTASETASDTTAPEVVAIDSHAMEVVEDVDAVEIADAIDDVPAVVTCPTPTFMAQYPPPFPPFPYGVWPVVEGCLDAPHDVIIVLGCPSEDDGSPAPCQEKRAEIADQLYEAGWARHFIVSGAAVHTPWVEADALAALLVARGIPDAAILREPLARHTDENIYYATRIMQREGWRSAIVVSEDPGHLMYTGLCDASCCVGLGRMTLVGFPVAGVTVINAGHYALAPPGPGVTDEECAHLAALALCVNLDERLACEDDFQLEE
ncbi:MAG: YdcF family protein [Deltaproteobacteria bacterium]|nr:YdcF family protein [Deltaproteobacteria bacterium]